MPKRPQPTCFQNLCFLTQYPMAHLSHLGSNIGSLPKGSSSMVMPPRSGVRGSLLSTAGTCKGFSDSSCCCFRIYFWQSSSVEKRQGVAVSSRLSHAYPQLGSSPFPTPLTMMCSRPFLANWCHPQFNSSEKLSSHLALTIPKGCHRYSGHLESHQGQACVFLSLCPGPPS